ncbi:MAG: hypothetical protein LBJ23_05665 [Tannerella sp.]|jgi:hypothetical protein|nr:hypothetical protein [Tannerella sp.]
MKKMMMVCLLLLPLGVYAQRQTEYNRRGDEAMGKKDYRDAKMWYEEGVTYCNSYSIDQLTKIWQADETMHLSMRTAMANCLNCLNEQALEHDTAAMKKLIVFYAEGIGTARSESSAGYWKNLLEQTRQPYAAVATPYAGAPKERMHFFIGYQSAPLSFFGIQFGGFNSRLGWYLRLHSDFSFQNPAGTVRREPDGDGMRTVLENVGDEFRFARETGRTKSNKTLTGSVGIMVKTAEDLYLSAGAGYWTRDVLRQFQAVDDDGNDLPATFMVNDPDLSRSGMKIDADAVYLFGKRFYGTVGCSVYGFKYVYPEAGIGVYF